MLTLPAASLAMTSQFPFMLAELGDALLQAGCAKRVVRLRELIAEAIPGLPSDIQLAKSIEQGNTKLGVLWRNYYALLLACAGGCVAQSQRLLHPESPELNPSSQSQRLLHPESPELNPSSKPLATPPPLPPTMQPPPPDDDEEDDEDEGQGHLSEAPSDEAHPMSLATSPTLPAKFDRLVATALGGEGSTEMEIWGDGDLGGEGSTEMGMWLMGSPHTGFNGHVPPPPQTGSARASMPPPLKLSARVGAGLPPVTAPPPLLGGSVQPPSPPPSLPPSPCALEASSLFETKLGRLPYETFRSVLIGGRGVGGCTPAAADVKQVEMMFSDGEARISPVLDLLWSSLNLETVTSDGSEMRL